MRSHAASGSGAPRRWYCTTCTGACRVVQLGVDRRVLHVAWVRCVFWYRTLRPPFAYPRGYVHCAVAVHIMMREEASHDVGPMDTYAYLRSKYYDSA